MEIAVVAQWGGVLLLAAASLRAGSGVLSYARRMQQGITQDKDYLEQFRGFSNAALETFEAERRKREPAWRGTRRFRIAKRAYENQSRDICSFYLVPYDGRPLPPFRPGQFLSCQLPMTGEAPPVTRCYSLSSSPTEQRYYRVSIKRLRGSVRAPAGLVSNYFHDRLREGAIVEASAPSGAFCLEEDSSRPVVLIAGGVGLTPLVSMLSWLVATGSKREIWFFYGARNRADHAMYSQFQAMRRRNSNIRMVTAYSRPGPSSRKGVDYEVKGRLSAELIWPVLQGRRCDIYICGPDGMMDALTQGLVAHGVPREDIRREGFGSASPAQPAVNGAAMNGAAAHADGKTFRVKFLRSGKTVQWSPRDGSLLDLAEASGVKARCACRQGICGTCVAALKQGKVGYPHPPENPPAAGACLPCIAQPRSDLVLDL